MLFNERLFDAERQVDQHDGAILLADCEVLELFVAAMVSDACDFVGHAEDSSWLLNAFFQRFKT